MILGAFRQAFGQLADPRFRRVAVLGLGLTLALLFAVYALFLMQGQSLAPDHTELPFIGRIDGVADSFGGPSLIFLLVASVILMMPVAAAFVGLFLPDVAAAVEARHYAFLPPPLHPQPTGLFIATINLLGLMLTLNLAAVILVLPLTGPAYVLVYWGLNGALLGRACFLFVALRRLSRAEALAMRRRNRLVVWGAGSLMALMLSLPPLNLMVPLLGAAAFTHLYHRLAAAGR